jgi:hypothetical protein
MSGLAKGRVGTNDHVPALLLLPLDLRQELGVPSLGTVHVPCAQLHRQAVAVPISERSCGG